MPAPGTLQNLPGEQVDTRRGKAGAFDLDVDPTWAADYVRRFWSAHTREAAWQARTEKAKSVWKIYQGRNVPGDGSAAFPRLHKDFLLRTLINVWADLVKKHLFPPKSQWLEITGPDGQRRDEYEAVALLLRRMLRRTGFEQKVRDIIRDSALFYGVVTLVYFDRWWDDTEGRWVEGPEMDVFNLKDFVLDTAAEVGGGVRPNVAYQFWLTREQLRQRASGPDAPYDPDAVERAIAAQHSGDARDQNWLALEADAENGQDDGGRGAGDDKVKYRVVEFRGCPWHPTRDMPPDCVITVVGDMALRAQENRQPVNLVDIWTGRIGPDRGHLGENDGEILAEANRNINFLGSLLLFVSQIKAMPTLALDVDPSGDGGENFLKYAPLIKLGVGHVVPNPGGLKTLEVNTDPSWLVNRMESIRKEAKEFIGVSDAALANLPSPSTTATAFHLTSQASQTRTYDDAAHYNQFVERVVQKMLVLVRHSMTEPETVTLESGEEFTITPDLLAGMALTAEIKNMAVNSSTGYQQQATMQFIQQAQALLGQEFDPKGALKLMEQQMPVPIGTLAQLTVTPQAPPVQQEQPAAGQPPALALVPPQAGPDGLPPEPVPPGFGGLLAGQEVPA